MNFGPDGQLWVGDVGWELYEMVYNVKPGGNYGWSIVEGPHTVIPDGKRGPTPIVAPAVAYSHAEGASVTGGFVYQGSQLSGTERPLHFRRLRDSANLVCNHHEERRWQRRFADRPD